MRSPGMIPGFRTREPVLHDEDRRARLKSRAAGALPSGPAPARVPKTPERRRSIGDVRQDDLQHFEACEVRGCARCTYVRNEESWREKLPAGGSGQSWLQSEVKDGRWQLACWVCRAAGVDDHFAAGMPCKLLGNLRRHHNSKTHRDAVRQLGLSGVDESDDDLGGAPSEESFMQVMEHRQDGRSLQKPPSGVGGRNKATKMQSCLAWAIVLMDQQFLREAVAVSIFQDLREHRLLIRFQACDSQLQRRRGVFGFVSLGAASGSAAVTEKVEEVIRDFFVDMEGNVDMALCDQVRRKVEMYCSDAASEELLTGRQLHASGFLHNMRHRVCDKAHGIQRVLSRPWSANAKLKAVLDHFALGSDSLTAKIQYSPQIQASAWLI